MPSASSSSGHPATVSGERLPQRVPSLRRSACPRSRTSPLSPQDSWPTSLRPRWPAMCSIFPKILGHRGADGFPPPKRRNEPTNEQLEPRSAPSFTVSGDRLRDPLPLRGSDAKRIRFSHTHTTTLTHSSKQHERSAVRLHTLAALSPFRPSVRSLVSAGSSRISL